MIGAATSEPYRLDRCNRCRHWVEDAETRDPNDPDWGFGECRRSAPVLVSSLVGAQIDRPRYGQQEDLDVSVTELLVATRFPVTSATDWCGRHEAAPAAVAEPDLAILLRERNELIDRLDGESHGLSEAEVDEGLSSLNGLDNRIIETPAVTVGDAIAKLVLLVQISAEGHEVPEEMARAAVADVAPVVGMGRVGAPTFEAAEA